MAMVDVLFGKSAELRRAEANLIAREDEVFKLQPGEEEDFRVHVRSDVPRYQLLNARGALNNAMTKQLSNRNLVLTSIGFAVVLAKLFGGFDILFKVIGLVH